MTWEEMTSMAAEEGFAAAVVTDTKDIPFDPSFRPLCAENLCGKYGANYSCPPDCGTPDEMRARIQAHRHALVLQTIWEIADYSDSKAIKAAKKEHNAATLRLLGRLRRADVPGFPVGDSGGNAGGTPGDLHGRLQLLRPLPALCHGGRETMSHSGEEILLHVGLLHLRAQARGAVRHGI